MFTEKLTEFFRFQFTLNAQDELDRVIRPKPEDRINKNHMTEYLVPKDRKNK